jgi:dienelactone hydrolase
MTVLAETSERGLRKLTLSVRRPGENVPAVVWLPDSDAARWPAVLLSHGGGLHKEARYITRLAERLVRDLGCAAVAIDQPYHGERTPPGERGLTPLERRSRIGLDAWRARNSSATAQAVDDWQATIDAVRGLGAGEAAPFGYFGLSLGTRFGIPLTAVEPRITCAVFGLFGHPGAGDVDAAGFAEATRQITVPVLFLMQWDDELFPRDGGLALFDRLGSARKTLHANPGSHTQIPPPEMVSMIGFFRRQFRGGDQASTD